MKEITAILIDDEKKSLSILKNKIEQFCPTIKIIAETESPEKGLEFIQLLKPQLLFLDIAMPKMSGFDLLKQVENPDFEIIFVTAFGDYAIEAIKHCAIGYLLKPIINNDLVTATTNAIQNIKTKTALKKNQLLIENLGMKSLDKKISIPFQEGIEFVLIREIIHLEGVNGYTKIFFLNREPILSSYSIGHFHDLLKNQKFYLVHKSHLININHIEKYLNQGYVLLAKNHKAPVSRNRRNDFLNTLQNKI